VVADIVQPPPELETALEAVLADLASRDVVSRAMTVEIREGRVERRTLEPEDLKEFERMLEAAGKTAVPALENAVRKSFILLNFSSECASSRPSMYSNRLAGSRSWLR